MPPRHHHGFSLLELLLSVVVIGILTAFLAAFSKSISAQGRSTKCVNNLRQLATATFAYAADHGGEAPPVDRINPNTGSSWYAPLAHYLPHPGYGKRGGAYFCPENPTRVIASGNAGWTNYSINANLYTVNTSLAVAGQSDPDYIQKRRGSLLGALSSPKVYYIDAFNGNAQAPATWYVNSGARYSNPWADTHAVHSGRVNAVFTDGHVESLKIAPRPARLSADSDLLELKASTFWPL